MKKLFCMLPIIGLLLSGCGGSDSKKAAVVDYTKFVKTEVVKSGESLAPVNINRFIFIDYDRNNDQAYDDVLSGM